MVFKSLEEKILHDMDKLEEENTNLKQANELLAAALEKAKEREQAYKDLLTMFNIHYHESSYCDKNIVQVDSIYPADGAVYDKTIQIINDLDLVVPFRN